MAELPPLNTDAEPTLEPVSRRNFLVLSAGAAAAAGAGVYVNTGPNESLAAPAAQMDPFLPNPLETRVIGPSTLLAGSVASLRVVTTNHDTGRPVAGAALRIAMQVPLADGKSMGPKTLFTGKTDNLGTTTANFRVPSLPPGSYPLTVTTFAPLGTDKFDATVTLQDSAQILLTTDKPLYQPAQTMHLRILALTRPNQTPVAEGKVIFEVEDSKGNKVFKKPLTTSKFGVAATEFTLADEVNLGRYTVRVILGETVQERTVTVDRYVLPKFKVTLKPDKTFYRPGETIKATLQADYFFGKPVAGAKVTLKGSSFEAGFHDFAELQATTSPSGSASFQLKLPDYMTGVPLENGNAFAKLEAAVVDTASHREVITQNVTVAAEVINLAVVPEGAGLAPGVENVIYVFTSYPDHTPAQTHFRLQGSGVNISGTTDAMGIGEVRLTPHAINKDKLPNELGFTFGDGPPTPGIYGWDFEVTAQDSHGQTGKKSVHIDRRAGEESLILRTDKSIATVGSRVTADVITTRASGTVYLDVIRDSQTILTRAEILKAGRARLNLDLDPSLAGTLQLHAYIITARGDIVRDTRLVYVNPANDLKIGVRPDKSTYRPGDPAELKLQVTDNAGHGIAAALGIQIVDESVFALQDMQPGMEQVYFTLEKELLEPKVEIHGWDAEELIHEPVSEKPLAAASRQKAARVLFAAAASAVTPGLAWNSYDAKWQSVSQKWLERLTADATTISRAAVKYAAQHPKEESGKVSVDTLVHAGLIPATAARDPLGTIYQMSPYPGQTGPGYFTLTSAGPDKKFETDDDIGVVCYGPDNIQPWGIRRSQRERGPRGFAFDVVDGPEMIMRNGAVAGTAVPMAQPAPAVTSAAEAPQPKAEPVRLRQYFPETLFVAPNVITAEDGTASLKFNLADSITTWRLSALASSARGALGSTSAPLKVFQDFFVDLDLPVSLTQGDEISIPVAVYNYLPEPQAVSLRLETAKEGWFELAGDLAEKSVQMAGNQVSAVHFRIKATGVGNHQLTVTAHGTTLSDAIRRSIEVLPHGRKVENAANDRLSGTVTQTVAIPKEAVEGGSAIFVRLYPGAFSQVVDGLDKMLAMPYGCFEQNASTTYPNILILDYLRRTRQARPELQMKAEGYLNNGYQRALTYEVAGGGFSWFGDAPAHKVLTAYGLLMFKDLARVFSTDPNVLARTQAWLADKQQADGSWAVDQGGIAEGIINRQTDIVRVTAYILWALAETGFRGPQLQKAANYLSPRVKDVKDNYALAVLANALLNAAPKSPITPKVLETLAAGATQKGNGAFWEGSTTFTGAVANGADLETTALAAYALQRSGNFQPLVNKALTYLVQHKDPQGTWGSTQATVWSLRALLAALSGLGNEANGEVIIRLNGHQVGAFVVTSQDSDVMRQLELKQNLLAGDNKVELQWSGKGSAMYAVTSRYYLPWPAQTTTAQPLSVNVAYDRTHLAVDDMVNCKVKVQNRQSVGVKNVILDLGIPPGFELQAGDLAELVGQKKIAKFSLTGRVVIVYLTGLKAGEVLEFTYRLKAKFPLRAQSPRSAVYEYYTPDRRMEAAPTEFIVKAAV